MTLSKTSGDFVGGLCHWWYTPVENLNGFPAVDPLTQMAFAEPVLKATKTWYGPVGVPDNQLGWEEDSNLSKAGIFYKQKVSGIITGLDADTHINLQNMAYHQFCVVGKARSGGNHYIIGNNESGLDLLISSTTGLGADNSPDTKFTLTGESIDRALILKSFLGVNSMLPVGSGTMVIVSNGSGIDIATYTASGTEGVSITLPVVAGRAILLFFRETAPLTIITTAPDPRQVRRSPDGSVFTFYSPLEAGESIKILYKS